MNDKKLLLLESDSVHLKGYIACVFSFRLLSTPVFRNTDTADILAGSIFWTILQFCYSLGCLGVIVQQISRVCDWLREVLKLGAVPASRLSHARWTTTVGWV